jgi:hypothetical protein
MPRVDIAQLAAANRLQGPYHLFSNSFILDFLEPPEELAATYVSRHLPPVSYHKILSILSDCLLPAPIRVALAR